MIKGIIFDLDGVIVSTDEYHYLAWKHIADEVGIPFDRKINDQLRGVSRMESLEIILKSSRRNYTDSEKLALADRKNSIYRDLLNQLTPDAILPGVRESLEHLHRKGIKLAIGSSSKNTPMILERIALADQFDACADGNQIRNSKPDPEVFLLAAQKLDLPPSECLVVEDAEAGIEAAIRGGMESLAVGSAASDPRATYRANELSQIVWLC